MLDAKRVRSLMDERQISQAALARRVGISQQSVARLVSGSAMGTRHLHQIARELRTTPAYLSGETDDPQAEMPDDHLSGEERQWIDLLRQLDEEDRRAVMRLTASLAGCKDEPPPTLHDPKLPYQSEGSV